MLSCGFSYIHGNTDCCFTAEAAPEQGLPANKQQPVDIYQWQVKGIGMSEA